MTNFWDERYSTDEYVFGEEPNVFFKSVIDTLKPGKLLVPAAGEGRDAVYAATLGWDVHALDQSSAARTKTLRLAAEMNVSVDFTVCSIEDFIFRDAEYDAAALIYFHLPPSLRRMMLTNTVRSLRKNGMVIIEAFTPKQIGNTSGGPSEPERLLTKEILLNELGMLKVVMCEELTTVLAEGNGHSGTAEIVRFIGTLP